jgi:hypothetical protein
MINRHCPLTGEPGQLNRNWSDSARRRADRPDARHALHDTRQADGREETDGPILILPRYRVKFYTLRELWVLFLQIAVAYHNDPPDEAGSWTMQRVPTWTARIARFASRVSARLDAARSGATPRVGQSHLGFAAAARC